MKETRLEETAAPTRTVLKPSEWMVGGRFAVPIKKAARLANQQTCERLRLIELVVGIAKRRPADYFTELQRRRRNGRLGHGGFGWVFPSDLAGGEWPRPQEDTTITNFTKPKT